jgi:hypothetical protein
MSPLGLGDIGAGFCGGELGCGCEVGLFCSELIWVNIILKTSFSQRIIAFTQYARPYTPEAKR